jgi:hypothetical protein
MKSISIRELERFIRQVRARRAVSRIRKRARQTGTGTLSSEEIESEIRAARAERTREDHLRPTPANL